MAEESGLLGRNEAAEFLEISTRTIDRYVRARKLTLIRRKGKLFFRKSDLEDLKMGREAHSPALISHTELRTGGGGAAEKYQILWEAAREELRQKEKLLLELHQRLGFLEAELRHSIPMLQAENSRSVLEQEISGKEKEVDLLRKKLAEARLRKITAFVLCGVILIIFFVFFFVLQRL